MGAHINDAAMSYWPPQCNPSPSLLSPSIPTGGELHCILYTPISLYPSFFFVVILNHRRTCFPFLYSLLFYFSLFPKAFIFFLGYVYHVVIFVLNSKISMHCWPSGYSLSQFCPRSKLNFSAGHFTAFSLFPLLLHNRCIGVLLYVCYLKMLWSAAHLLWNLDYNVYLLLLLLGCQINGHRWKEEEGFISWSSLCQYFRNM
jgi:hypothetical protein